MIGKLKKIFETQTTILQKKAGVFKNEEIVCEVDETPIDCADLQENYTGIPSPDYLEDDEWFGPATLSKKSEDVVQKESEIKQQHEEQKKELVAAGIIIEDENIHQKMYEMATKNWNTVAETQGGSENFHEGPGGWNSGNGFSRVSG